VTYTHPRRIRKWVERGIKLSKLTSKKMSFGFKKFLSPHDLLIFFGFHATNSVNDIVYIDHMKIADVPASPS
jgi:hypothetical protein